MKKVTRIAGFTLLLVWSCFALRVHAQVLPERRTPPLHDTRKIMEKVAHAIVHLDVIRQIPSVIPSLSLPYFPFLGFSPMGQGTSILSLLSARTGTGILVDSGGGILTNTFLVSGAQEIRVRLFDGKEMRARVLGTDMDTDLTLLKIDGARPFPKIPFGDSDKVAIGQRVFAMEKYTSEPVFSEGIVCARHQKGVIAPRSYRDFLQTDLWIGLSNSGSPLLNERGEIIGITDALLSRLAGLKGVGFAIPWNMAAYVIHQIRRFGRVERGWLGLAVQDVLLRSHRLPNHIIRGVMIVGVQTDSPARAAGLRPGDVILQYQEKPVRESLTLKRLVSNTPVGEKVELLIMRNEARENVTLTIGARRGEKSAEDMLRRCLGIAVRPVGKQWRGAPRSGRGVAITWIDADSPMARAGFEIDDLIIEANGWPIRSGKDLEKILRKLGPDHRVTFLAVDHRTNRTGYVQVRAR